MLPILTRRQTCGLLLGATSSIVATNFCDIRPAKAGSILEVTPGTDFKPITIAVTQFAGDSGSQISSIITNNFNRSVFLQPVNPSAFAGQQINPDAPIQPASWQSLAQFVVTGRSAPGGNGRLQTQFRLWDTSNGQQVAAKQYVTDPNNSRRVAHIISDAIFVQVTGATKGCFDTRVVFVDETGPATHRRKRLAIMDQDGANVRYLTRGDEFSVVTPRFSPSSQDVTYMAFNNAGAKVLLLNIETGQREAVGNFPGMTFAPRFSPDGQKIIMSLAENGVSNLYSMDIRSRQTTRLSNSNAIDTSPSYSPDGSQIVFNSDRGGSQQIYVMSGSGGMPSISHGQGTYSTPVWSPTGEYIAFTKQVDGQFAIGVMKPDGSGERILTEGFHNEGPTWAPNGLYLMFFRDPGGESGAHIFMRDVLGHGEFPVPTPSYASDPAWGPLLG